jgi:hypothetical protein
MYHDVLGTYEKDLLANVCSPSLAGSNGVCPLVIISTIPDIARHMSNLIVRAQHEVFLLTNFWMHSEPSRLIDEALRELSRRAVAENRNVVVKVVYDRGSAKQVSVWAVKSRVEQQLTRSSSSTTIRTYRRLNTLIPKDQSDYRPPSSYPTFTWRL